MAKFEKQLFNKNKIVWHDTSSCTCSIYLYNVLTKTKFFGMTLLHAHAKYIYNVLTKTKLFGMTLLHAHAKYIYNVLTKTKLFDMTLLHAHAKYIYNVLTKTKLFDMTLLHAHAKYIYNVLTKTKLFDMTLLHAHAQYIYNVNAKHQKPSVKALVQVDFPVYAQAKSLFKSKQEKMAYFTKLLFCPKTFFWHQTSSCKCSMSLYCAGKVLNCFGTSCGTS